MSANGETTIYTIGYEGKEQAEVIDALRHAGVEVLVDVRDAARSRRHGFAKSSLSAALAEAGIAYRHVPELGCPRDMRLEYRRTGDHAAWAAGYLAHVRSNPAALDELMRLCRESAACLFCLEADAEQCHRSLLAAELQVAAPGAVRLRHL